MKNTNSFRDSFGSLTINGISSTVSLGVSTTVRGTLTFTGGTITTGSYTIYLDSTGTVSRTSGHVIGNFQKNFATGAISKTFEIGDASNYMPLIVAFASVTTAGDLKVSTAAGDHSNIGSAAINASLTANRNWTLTNSGIVFTNYDVTFNFVAGDLDAAATTSNFSVGQYTAGWTYPTVGTKTSTSTQASSVTVFGDFQLGETGDSTTMVPNTISYSGNATAVYPNPVIGTVINVRLPNESLKEFGVIIYSMNGQVVFSNKVTASSDGTFTIGANTPEKLSSGVYLLSLFSGNRSYQEKLILQ